MQQCARRGCELNQDHATPVVLGLGMQQPHSLAKILLGIIDQIWANLIRFVQNQNPASPKHQISYGYAPRSLFDQAYKINNTGCSFVVHMMHNIFTFFIRTSKF